MSLVSRLSQRGFDRGELLILGMVLAALVAVFFRGESTRTQVNDRTIVKREEIGKLKGPEGDLVPPVPKALVADPVPVARLVGLDRWAGSDPQVPAASLGRSFKPPGLQPPRPPRSRCRESQ